MSTKPDVQTVCPVCWLVGPCDCEGVPSVAAAPPQPRGAVVRQAPAAAPARRPGQVAAAVSASTTSEHPVARAAVRLASKYPALLTLVASVRATSAGTIGRSATEPGLPGGVGHHDISREVRDVLWTYAEIALDVLGIREDPYSNAVFTNARLIVSAAEQLERFEPVGCAGHDVPRFEHASVADHLDCLDDRVTSRIEPPGAREFVGPCPEKLVGGGTCGLDLRAYDVGPARCPAGHVHQVDAVRAQAVADVGERLLTLRDVADVAPRLTDRQITLESLRLKVKRKQLVVTRHDSAGAALVRWPDVRTAYRLG